MAVENEESNDDSDVEWAKPIGLNSYFTLGGKGKHRPVRRDGKGLWNIGDTVGDR